MTNPEPYQASEKELQRDKLVRNLYFMPTLGSSVAFAYFGNYMGMLFTDIFMMPVLLAGALEVIRSAVGWISQPLIGAFIDRKTFKIGKYWQYIILGGIGSGVLYMLTFGLPIISSNPQSLGVLVFIFAVLLAVTEPLQTTPNAAIFPQLGKTPDQRAFMAIQQKVGRDGGKTVWGLIIPLLIVYFTETGGSQAAGWASTGVVCGIYLIVFYVIYAFLIKGTSVEMKAQVEKQQEVTGRKKAKVPFSQVLKVLVTNKALLAMFAFLAIHKIYFVVQLQSATYFFQYVFQDFAKLGLFMSTYTLAAVAGVFFGVLWKKIFKETKWSLVAAGAAHVIILGILTVSFKSLSVNTFILFVAGYSFFAGLVEAYILPMFAAASDWSAWKTGERSDGLTMSIYGISVKVGIVGATTMRASMLASAGYDAAAYSAGAAPSAEVLGTLINMQTLIPFILAIVCFGIVALFYPLTDKKLAKINEELEAGRVGENRNEAAVESA